MTRLVPPAPRTPSLDDGAPNPALTISASAVDRVTATPALAVSGPAEPTASKHLSGPIGQAECRTAEGSEDGVGDVIVRAEGVGWRIEGATILDDVTLSVRAGEVLAIVGPNGAGKSTLLGLLAGDTHPTSGAVTWADGRPLGRLPLEELARRRCVMLQDSGVAFAFRVVEIVRMGRQPWRASASEAEDEVIVAEALEQTETTALALRRFPSLSGGEKARVAFARALAQTPVLFLLDEPTAALDLHHQERVLARARDLAAVGDAVVVVLHDLTLAAAYADRVAVLDGGRLACVDAPGAALTSELLSRVYAHPVEVLRHPRTGAPLVLPVRGGEEGESR